MAKGFSTAMVEVFKRAGQNSGDFLKELKELTAEDKRWYYQELKKSGVDVLEPGAVATTSA